MPTLRSISGCTQRRLTSIKDLTRIQYGAALREFDEFCKMRFRSGGSIFISNVWNRFFRIHGPTVREFLLEFFCMVDFKEHRSRLDEMRTLVFQLGGEPRSITMR